MENIFDDSILPKDFDSIKHNFDVKEKLKKLTSVIIEFNYIGSESSGKHTLVLAYLSRIYGLNVYKKT